MTIKYAFRITHIDNIPHIMEYGLLKANSPNRNENFVSIGDPQVISVRHTKVIAGISLADCIPFYLGPRSPMLYVIQNGYNGVRRQNPEKVVYCVIRIEDIINSDLDCLFSDGHALNQLTKFYTKDNLKDINKIVRYTDVYASQWNNNELDTDIKRRKEAELLVKHDIPVNYICGYIVYNNAARTTLLSYGIPDNMIVIKPEYYF